MASHKINVPYVHVSIYAAMQEARESLQKRLEEAEAEVERLRAAHRPTPAVGLTAVGQRFVVAARGGSDQVQHLSDWGDGPLEHIKADLLERAGAPESPLARLVGTLQLHMDFYVLPRGGNGMTFRLSGLPTTCTHVRRESFAQMERRLRTAMQMALERADPGEAVEAFKAVAGGFLDEIEHGRGAGAEELGDLESAKASLLAQLGERDPGLAGLVRGLRLGATLVKQPRHDPGDLQVEVLGLGPCAEHMSNEMWCVTMLRLKGAMEFALEDTS